MNSIHDQLWCNAAFAVDNCIWDIMRESVNGVLILQQRAHLASFIRMPITDYINYFLSEYEFD